MAPTESTSRFGGRRDDRMNGHSATNGNDDAASVVGDVLDQGFAVIRRFVDDDEVQRLACLVEDRLGQSDLAVLRRPHNSLLALGWSDAIVRLLLSSPRRIEFLREVLDAPDLRWLSGYITIKDPHSPALWWHQDWWCWDHPISFRRPPTQVAVLCYLTETASPNGALRVLPGSHHRSFPLHAHLPEAHGDCANALVGGAPAMADAPQQVTLAVARGDAVVVDYRLLHGTHANETDERRDCIHLSFIPAWATLPSELKAHYIAHPAQPSRRDLVHDAPVRRLLPVFAGPPASLRLSRIPPADFAVR